MALPKGDITVTWEYYASNTSKGDRVISLFKVKNMTCAVIESRFKKDAGAPYYVSWGYNIHEGVGYGVEGFFENADTARKYLEQETSRNGDVAECIFDASVLHRYRDELKEGYTQDHRHPFSLWSLTRQWQEIREGGQPHERGCRSYHDIRDEYERDRQRAIEKLNRSNDHW